MRRKREEREERRRAQEARKRQKKNVKGWTQEECVGGKKEEEEEESRKSTYEDNDVSNRHMTWWKRAFCGRRLSPVIARLEPRRWLRRRNSMWRHFTCVAQHPPGDPVERAVAWKSIAQAFVEEAARQKKGLLTAVKMEKPSLNQKKDGDLDEMAEMIRQPATNQRRRAVD